MWNRKFIRAQCVCVKHTNENNSNKLLFLFIFSFSYFRSFLCNFRFLFLFFNNTPAKWMNWVFTHLFFFFFFFSFRCYLLSCLNRNFLQSFYFFILFILLCYVYCSEMMFFLTSAPYFSTKKFYTCYPFVAAATATLLFCIHCVLWKLTIYFIQMFRVSYTNEICLIWNMIQR